MKIFINDYPFNADCAFAVTLDDLHPEGKQDKEHLDFGLDFNSNFWHQLDSLSNKIPSLKFTLFTPANWQDRSNYPGGVFWPLRKIYSRRRSYKEGFNLTDKKYKGWTHKINKKIVSGQIAVSFHGLSHHNDDKKYSASQEFLGISDAQIEIRISEMLAIVKKSGLLFEKGFRSPGWGTTKGLNNILAKNNFLYSANSTDFSSVVENNRAHGAGVSNQKLYEPNFLKDGLVNFTANCYPHQIKRAIDICRKKGILVVHAHVAKTIFGLKYVDKHFAEKIEKMVREIKLQTQSHIWFASLGEIAEFIKAKEKVVIKKLDGDKIQIENRSEYALRGLTLKINNQPRVISHISPGQSIIISESDAPEKKKVSIILTVYNGQKMVIDSLESLCNQNYRNIEIIIVNDGSTDNTKKFLEAYLRRVNDKRITLISQKNGGRSNARNNGFKRSSGQVITFCEDDAIYDKDYILRALDHFKGKDKKLAGVIGPHFVLNKNESINTRVKDVERRRNFYKYKPQSCWFYERNTFQKIGMFDEGLELVEDVAPALLLKKEGYHFIFESNSLWLHREPAKLGAYLRRKFRGGVGMSLLEKRRLKRDIIPRKVFVLLMLLVFLGFILLLKNLLLFFLGLAFLFPFAFIIRWKSFKIARSTSNESLIFIIFSIFYEYIWWVSTFFGYLYGKRMSEQQINSYLKGR